MYKKYVTFFEVVYVSKNLTSGAVCGARCELQLFEVREHDVTLMIPKQVLYVLQCKEIDVSLDVDKINASKSTEKSF